MRGFVGTSQAENINEAIEQATSGLKNADLLILLAPFHKAAQAAARLSEKYPDIPMIGTCGASIGKNSMEDGQIVVAGFAGVTVASGLMSDIRRAPITYIKDFENNLKSIQPDSSNTICIEFVTGSEEKLLSTAGSVLSRYNIALAGGSSDGVPLGEKHIVIYNGHVYNRSCVYAFIKNNVGKIKLFAENIYDRPDKKIHIASLTDPNTKALFLLDGRPAYDVYSEDTGCDREYIVDNMPYNPLGRIIGNDVYITKTISIDANGVMFNAKALYENDKICIMKPGDYRAIHESTLADIKANTNRISFLLAFESVNRLKLFADSEYLDEYTDSMSTQGAFAALVSQNQQYNRQNCNQTLVCVVFE